MVKRKQGAYQDPVDPPTFSALSMEHLEWLDSNFDMFQETYHRKWGELAKQMRKVFAIPERVDGITVRNKLLSYWVRFGKPSRVINYSRTKFSREARAAAAQAQVQAQLQASRAHAASLPAGSYPPLPSNTPALPAPDATQYSYIEYNPHPENAAHGEGTPNYAEAERENKEGEHRDDREGQLKEGEGKGPEDKEKEKEGEEGAKEGEGEDKNKEDKEKDSTSTTTSTPRTPYNNVSPSLVPSASPHGPNFNAPFPLSPYQAQSFTPPHPTGRRAQAHTGEGGADHPETPHTHSSGGSRRKKPRSTPAHASVPTPVVLFGPSHEPWNQPTVAAAAAAVAAVSPHRTPPPANLLPTQQDETLAQGAQPIVSTVPYNPQEAQTTPSTSYGRLPPIVKILERRNPTARRKEYLVERQGCAARWENQSTAQSNAQDRRAVFAFDLWWEQRQTSPQQVTP